LFDIGLPTTLADLGLQAVTDADLARVGELAMKPTNVIHSVPVELTAGLIANVIRTASILAEQRKTLRSSSFS
jgi:glycerol dehydrogenase